MRAIGEYVGATRSLQGDLVISFAIDDDMAEVEKLEKTKGKALVIETKRYSEKRSLNANAYFWKLCDKIATVLRTDKDAVYMLQLSKYGVFVDIQSIPEGMQIIRDKFRYVEEFNDGFGNILARCYFGSSHYTRAEMARLIDGTVQDAKDLGIDTMTPDEINRLIEAWEVCK